MRSVLVLLAVLLLLEGCAALQPEGEVVPVEAPVPSRDGQVEVGKPYFDFTAPDLRGGRIRLSERIGKQVLLLQFWGIRCGPCLEEVQLLSRLQERYGTQGFQVIGVNTDRVAAGDLIKAMEARRLAPAYPIVLDADHAVAQHYTQWLIPVTVLIDRFGLVQAVHTGYKPELDTVIEAEVVRLIGR